MKNLIKKLRQNYDKATLDKKIPKIYLMLALFFGILFSFGMPIFSEPDGQYHFTDSSNMAGLTVDLSRYDITNPYSDIDDVLPSYQNGTYIDQFYRTKVHLMPRSELPRLNDLPQVLSYDYIGHFLPMVGIWLGYHLYPSLGIMITAARLLTVFVLAIAMYFIIRWVKYGKLYFAAVMLSPVALGQMASLSYDSLSFVICAAIIAVAINTIVDKKIGFIAISRMVLLSAISLVALKTNFLLLLVLFPAAIIWIFYSRWTAPIKQRLPIKPKRSRMDKEFENLDVDNDETNWSKRIIAGLIVVVVIVFIAVSSVNYGGIIDVGQRFFSNFTFNLMPANRTDFQSVVTQPYASINNMPFWLAGFWYLLIALLPFAEDKFVKSRWISYLALLLFVLNLVAIYFSYLSFGFDINVTAGYLSLIYGPQGRYLTPTLLLFNIFAGNQHFKLKIKPYKTALIATVIIVVISNSLLLFNTIYGALFMGV